MRKFFLLFLVAVLPLIMHLKFVAFPLEVLNQFRTAPLQPDIFNWWKNWLLYGVTGGLLIWKWDVHPFYRRCISFYSILVFLSALLSNYPEIVWYGMPNYLEGTLAILSYFILFMTAATIGIPTASFDRPLSFCTIAMFIATALQYFSPALFQTCFHWIVFGNNPQYQMSMETWPLFGTLMNQNILGTFAAITYGFFLARKKWVMTLLSVLLAVGCQSRGAWLAMLICTAYLAFKYRAWWVAVPFAFFAIGVGMVYTRATHEGFKWSVASSGRVYVWQKSLPLLSAFGHGPGAFAMEFDQSDAQGKRAQGWNPETIVDRPHNFYLQVWHASGLISLLALLALFGGFVLESKEIAINAAVLSYLVNVFFTDSCTSVAPIFWIFLGTGVSRLKILNREKNKWVDFLFQISSRLLSA